MTSTEEEMDSCQNNYGIWNSTIQELYYAGAFQFAVQRILWYQYIIFHQVGKCFD